ALVGEPRLLLCDEPLLSLDLASQRNVTELISDYRTRAQAAVIFVTHEINPILPWVDRVLYLVNGRWVADKPDKVLRSRTLSGLYDTPVEVIRTKGRVIVVGAEDAAPVHHEEHA
ncbi:MAG: ABC transporter ATP-binding protein, partial [Candidatus Saccharimonadales bacterium]